MRGEGEVRSATRAERVDIVADVAQVGERVVVVPD
jgi:hypothetical protein